MEQKIESGALIDNRTIEEKEKDYQIEELVANADQVNWKEIPKNEWRSFPIFNQNGSGSCVAQTGAKLLGILYWLKNQTYVHFSATHIYQRRANKPGGGMIGVDCMKIMTEGTTLEELVPSQNMTDKQMDGIEIPEYKKKVGEIFKISTNYVQIQKGDFEKVASVLQKTGKGIMAWFYFQYDEWTEEPFVKNRQLDLYSIHTARHSVTVTQAFLHKGKKYLLIEDSWGPYAGKGGQRLISEEFFKERNFFLAYPMNFEFDTIHYTEIPKYRFENTLRFSKDVKYGDKDIIALQNCLKWLGLFPKNSESTGYFGAITKKAVQEFQKAEKLVVDGIVGPATRGKLNAIFS